MRIVYFGTPELAVPALTAVAENHDVIAVVSQPDKPKGRSKKLAPPPVKTWALDHNIPVNQPVKLNDGTFEAWLKEQAPDVCCLAAYGRILKQPILDVPLYGFMNIHPSLLPCYRGVSPIQSAVLNGDTLTGVTIMRIDIGIDSGDIVLQKEEPILPDDTSGTLTDRLAQLGADMLIETLELIENGEATFTQQDHDKATHTEFFTKKHGRIVWAEPAHKINNLVRATNPWPVAHCNFRGQVCRIQKCSIVDDPTDASPGTVTKLEKDRVMVATGDGQIAIIEFQAPGKRAMAMTDYLRGHKIEIGECFEDIVDS